VARSSALCGAGTSPAWNEQFIFGLEVKAVGAADLKIQLVDWGSGGGGRARILGYIPRIPVSEMAKRRQVSAAGVLYAPMGSSPPPLD
jgi:hypothetical protein